MPIGQGFWPAFWMLSSDTSIYGPWAASGEIDIVEYIGSDPNRIFGTIHYGASFPGNIFSSTDYFLPSGTFNDDFHVFAMEWEFGEIRWYVDGVQYASRDSWFSTGGPFPAPFDVDFHLLLNMAVGGNLPGPPDGTTVFPQEYVIDYVRVYQVPNDPPVVAITSPTAGDIDHARRRPDDHRQRHRRRLDPARPVPAGQRRSRRGRHAALRADGAERRRRLLQLAGAGAGRRRHAGLVGAGGHHGRRRLPAGALPDDAGRHSGDDRGRELRPRRPGSGLQRRRRQQQRRRLPAGRGRRSRRHDRRRLRLQSSAGSCPASGSSTRWTSRPGPTTSRCGWPRRSTAARSTSSSTASTRPARSTPPAPAAGRTGAPSRSRTSTSTPACRRCACRSTPASSTSTRSPSASRRRRAPADRSSSTTWSTATRSATAGSPSAARSAAAASAPTRSTCRPRTAASSRSRPVGARAACRASSAASAAPTPSI